MEGPQFPKSPIKELRLRLSLNQNEFLMLIGKSQSFESGLESGNVDLPDDVVEKLEILGVDGQVICQEHQNFMEDRLAEIREVAIETLKNW